MKYFHVHSKSDTEFEFDKDLLNNNHIHSTFLPKSPEETSLNEFERKKSSYSNQYPKRKPSHANIQKKRRSILTNQYILQRPLDNYENYFANLLITIIKLKKENYQAYSDLRNCAAFMPSDIDRPNKKRD